MICLVVKTRQRASRTQVQAPIW